MKKYEKFIIKAFTFLLNAVPVAMIITVPVAMVIGWVLNIGKLIKSEFVLTSIMSIARLIGVFVTPLGSVLGFF